MAILRELDLSKFASLLKHADLMFRAAWKFRELVVKLAIRGSLRTTLMYRPFLKIDLYILGF